MHVISVLSSGNVHIFHYRYLNRLSADPSEITTLLAQLPPDLASFMQSHEFNEACRDKFKELLQPGEDTLSSSAVKTTNYYTRTVHVMHALLLYLSSTLVIDDIFSRLLFLLSFVDLHNHLQTDVADFDYHVRGARGEVSHRGPVRSIHVCLRRRRRWALEFN